ncbi:hypothetical protein ABWK22_02580 [Gottfriedia acidiceleris]|uniref:hypothetical protein n=1 Tax=Gottfriedia acidiceleris TaxID=371036 RepID=UPI003394F558
MFTQPGIIIKHPTQAGAILFQSAGYISISQETYEDSKITLSFATPTGKMVLIPKYLSDGNYLFISLDNENKLTIGGIVKESEKVYGVIDVSGSILSINNLVFASNGSHFTVTFNNQVVFKFESALFVNGQVRVYGGVGEVFYSCNIEEPQSIAWTTNGDSGGVEVKTITIEDHQYIKLIGSQTKKASISQSISLTSGTYTISFNAKGNGSFKAMSGSTVVREKVISETDLNYVVDQFTLTSSQSIEIVFETNGQLIVGKEQLETGSSATAYISNPSISDIATRKGSSLSFPLKEQLDKKVGSIYIKITPINTLVGEQKIVWTDTNELSIKNTSDNKIELLVGQDKVNIPIQLQSQTSYEIIGSWNEHEVTLSVNGQSNNIIVSKPITKTIQEVVFADETSIQKEVVLEEWALFNNEISSDVDIQSVLPEAIMYSLFDGGISGQNVTWSEIPVAPVDHSPILVQKENGDTLQKVSFFDYETGEYRTWNQEPFVYDGKADFAEVAYSNLDEQFRDIAIRTEDGEKIGEPYQIDGKRFYFNIPFYLKSSFKNKTLYATYQVNDTYTIDYNIKAVDGYRIDFAKHDGGKRVVYQEGNRYGEPKKLATMIDMNPIQNQNHEGFLYVTNTTNKTDSFRITATPDRLPADGSSFSTLIIEPLDYQGNFLSHSNIEIIASSGYVARHISRDAVEAQKRSGQYLYQYFAPYIHSDKEGQIVEDYIWIVDKDSDIGVCYKILLSPVSSPGVGQITSSDKEVLTAKTQIINYLLMYEGVEKYEDETLFNILDLNQDGRITIDEVLVLETNQKDQELTVILNKLKEWEDTNHAIATA